MGRGISFGAAAALVAVAALAPPGAGAHGGGGVAPTAAGHLRSVLAEAPDVRGLELRLLQGSIPALYVRNETGEVLEVPGVEGEPFLRIGPKGVRANLRSPTFYRAGGQAMRRVPSEAEAQAAPVWTRLSTEPAWAWLEQRARVQARGLQPVGLRAGRVARWTTPLRLGGRALAVTGHAEWVPAREVRAAEDSSSVAWPLPSAGAALVILLAVAGLIRVRGLRQSPWGR